MASQIPVTFRRNRIKVGLSVFFSGLFLIFAIYFSSFFAWIGILSIVFLILLLRGLVMIKLPYLFLSDHTLTVYRGFFLTPVRYHLNTVDSVYSLKPEAYIELLSETPSPKRKIKINLSPLDRKDRIRFIFLLESHVNRKKIFEHSIGKGEVWVQ